MSTYAEWINFQRKCAGLAPIEVKEPTPVVVKEEQQELLDKYIDMNKMYHFEGARGVKCIEKIVGVLGYGGLDEFLADNPGCQQAIVEWIGSANVPEWKEKLEAEVGATGEDDEPTT